MRGKALKIVQMVSHFKTGDAIGNEIIAMHRLLSEEGYDAYVTALSIHEDAACQVRMLDASVLQDLQAEDVAIFHKAAGDVFSSVFRTLRCRKVMIYHNITPASFFFWYDPAIWLNQVRGRRQVRSMAGDGIWAWGDSQYNCRELKEMGYPEDRIRCLPILMPPVRALPDPDPETLSRLKENGGTVFLFVGRVAPNKRHEEILRVFDTYKCTRDPKARLYLVGSWEGNEKYYAKLQGYIEDLKLRDVYFQGHVSEAEKEAYYAAADVFVCMSAHEGFCIPLIEAIRHDLPVVAYSAAAVPETIGGHALLFEEMDYEHICQGVADTLAHPAAVGRLVQEQKAAVSRFDYELVRKQFLELLSEVLGEKA